MKLNIFFPVMFAAASLFAMATLASADQAGEGESPLACPISGKAVNPGITTEYRGGTIAFCCAGCVAPFRENTEKYATQANRQLVRSGQAEQVGCPITGRPVSPDQSVEVAGVEVHFCCGGCKAKVVKAEDPEKLVFNDDGFQRAYEVSNEEESEQ